MELIPQEFAQLLDELNRAGLPYVTVGGVAVNLLGRERMTRDVDVLVPATEKQGRAIRELLVDGGRFSLTFDFQNPTRRARIGSARDLEEQFVAPSGLAVRGNARFHDNGKRYLLHPFYHPATPREERERVVQRGDFDAADLAVRKTTNDYTFGALFLEKTGP